MIQIKLIGICRTISNTYDNGFFDNNERLRFETKYSRVDEVNFVEDSL